MGGPPAWATGYVTPLVRPAVTASPVPGVQPGAAQLGLCEAVDQRSDAAADAALGQPDQERGGADDGDHQWGELQRHGGTVPAA